MFEPKPKFSMICGCKGRAEGRPTGDEAENYRILGMEKAAYMEDMAEPGKKTIIGDC